MSRKMLINASHPEENRVAIVVDGMLSELDIELEGQQQTKGNIYKAVVARVEPGLQAAFVDYGADKHGFLQIGELHPQLHPAKKANTKDRPRINDILHRGQEILVQVVKEQRGTKGAALTTFLSLPGRYMVLMPDSDTKGVSRKIQDEKERRTLKKTMAQLDLPDEMGYIVRTAGIGKEQAELARDFNYLVSLYKGLLARRDKVKAPAQLYQESDIVIRSIRDYFATDMDEVLIDDPQVYQQARDFFSLVMPDQLKLVKQHREKRPIFSRYQIEEQIEALASNHVPLPSGGSIVIDQTEALVAIDVNSGRMAGEKGIEATAARSNIEAAAEIGRQLRLRDLGGLIVIDFIDMRDRKKVREVEQTLWQSVKDDKARVTTGRISQFGLLEMSRQRIRPTLSVGAYLECPHCHGKGRIKSPEAQAVALLRQLHAAVSKGQIGIIEAKVPLDVANYLLNERRAALNELETRFDLKIQIYGSTDALPEQVELELRKREKTARGEEEQGPVSHAIGLEEALAASVREVSEADAAEAPEPATAEGQEQAGQEDAEASTGDTENETKRRRRRRRRRGGAKSAAGGAETGAEETSGEPEGIASDAEEAVTTPAPESEAGTEVGEKPKRRSRRGGRRKAAAEGTESAVAEEAVKETEDAAAPQPEEAVTGEAAEEKPKRRSRRGGRKKTTAAEAETMSTPEAAKDDSAPASPTSEPVAPVAAEAGTEEEQPKRTTQRGGRTKAETEAATAARETTPTAADAAQSAPAVEPAASEDAPAKPKRRTRKTTSVKAEEATSATEAPAAPLAEEKPQRRTRRTAAQKTEEAAAQTQVPATAAASAAIEEKPKRRTRKPATRKAEEAAAPAAGTEAAPAAEEKPKRRTRKPAAKDTAEAVAQPPVEQEAEPAAEKPKRRTRKPAAKKTEEAVASAPAPETSPATEEKPKRRTRKPAAKKEETTAGDQ